MTRRTTRRQGRRAGWLPAVVILGLLAARMLHGAAGATARAVLPTALPSGAIGDDLLVEPDDGMDRIDQLLASPRSSLDLTMYALSDPSAEAILAADAQRGVRVRVLLDHRLEARRNVAAYDYLRSSGVQVAWASPRFFATHEKAFVIDGRVAVIMSLNLESQYYATTRDVAVVDRDAVDVSAVESVFSADFANRSTGTPAADDLVWSPDQSAADLLALIDQATRTVDVESEELSSPPLVDALVRAARRGVAVRLSMTFQDKWAVNFRRIADAGGSVAVLYGERPVYIHAKLLVTDAGTPAGRAFIGSENLSESSLHHDRELGIVLLRPDLVDRISRLVRSDAGLGTPWRP